MFFSKQSCSLHATLIHKPDHYYDSLNIKLKIVFDCEVRENIFPWFINLTAARWGNFPASLISQHECLQSSPLFNNDKRDMEG